jgi:hypothetical protein
MKNLDLKLDFILSNYSNITFDNDKLLLNFEKIYSISEYKKQIILICNLTVSHYSLVNLKK